MYVFLRAFRVVSAKCGVSARLISCDLSVLLVRFLFLSRHVFGDTEKSRLASFLLSLRFEIFRYQIKYQILAARSFIFSLHTHVHVHIISLSLLPFLSLAHTHASILFVV